MFIFTVVILWKLTNTLNAYESLNRSASFLVTLIEISLIYNSFWLIMLQINSCHCCFCSDSDEDEKKKFSSETDWWFLQSEIKYADKYLILSVHLWLLLFRTLWNLIFYFCDVFISVSLSSSFLTLFDSVSLQFSFFII